MVTLDRIRLTGLLRKAPASSGAFYIPLWEVVGDNHSFQGADGTSASQQKEHAAMIKWRVRFVRVSIFLGALAAFAVASGAGERWAW